MRHFIRLLLTMAVSVWCAGAAAVAPPSRLPVEALRVVDLSPCTLPDVAQSAQCGVLAVPENPGRSAGRTLQIGIAVIPAAAKPANPDPIVVLMGGPGEGAISAASFYVRQFASLLKDRDLLLVDQRGTGRSGALTCDLYSKEEPAATLRDLFPPAAIERCVRRLRTHADLTQYSYTRFADDLEHVRRALGFGPLNLFSGSYGTRAAQVYLRAYPQSVRSAFLGSAVPLDVPTPLAMAKTAQTALDSVFGACAADAACHSVFPNLGEEFRQALTRLNSGAVRVSIPGRSDTVLLRGGRVAEWIRAKLYRPNSAAILPWVIHRAYLGDWSPIVEGILSDTGDPDFSFGLFFAITCSDDVAFLQDREVAAESQGTFLGDDRVRQQQAACKYWPKRSLPADFRNPVHSSVPALFVTGDADGGTPLWYTQRVSQGFANSVVVVARGQGHTEWSDCIGDLYERLVLGGTVRGLDASTCEPAPRPPFKTN